MGRPLGKPNKKCYSCSFWLGDKKVLKRYVNFGSCSFSGYRTSHKTTCRAYAHDGVFINNKKEKELVILNILKNIFNFLKGKNNYARKNVRRIKS